MATLFENSTLMEPSILLQQLLLRMNLDRSPLMPLCPHTIGPPGMGIATLSIKARERPPLVLLSVAI